MSYQVISTDRTVQAFYEQMRARGESHGMAEMLALRRPPGASVQSFVGIDDGFGDSPFENHARRMAKEKAAKVGVSTEGKRYVPTLAAEPLDPHAWVSDLSEAKNLVKRRRWTCQGKVNVKQQYADAAPKEKYEVSEKLLNQKLREKVTANPEIAPTPKERKELKEKLRKQYSGAV